MAHVCIIAKPASLVIMWYLLLTKVSLLWSEIQTSAIWEKPRKYAEKRLFYSGVGVVKGVMGREVVSFHLWFYLKLLHSCSRSVLKEKNGSEPFWNWKVFWGSTNDWKYFTRHYSLKISQQNSFRQERNSRFSIDRNTCEPEQ